jgi:hypothetical protein
MIDAAALGRKRLPALLIDAKLGVKNGHGVARPSGRRKPPATLAHLSNEADHESAASPDFRNHIAAPARVRTLARGYMSTLRRTSRQSMQFN